jgi:hypothetical protein
METNHRSCDNCRCGIADREFRRVVSDIENRVFHDVRDVLTAPSGKVHFPYPFHFAVLDGYERQAVSRGHDPDIDMTRSAAAERYTERIHRALATAVARGLPPNVTNILGCITDNGQLPEDIRHGFEAYSSIAGQPLADQASRFEQCVAIRTACDDGFDVVPADIRRFGGVFIVEDYLGPCRNVVSTYGKAMAFLQGCTASAEEPRHEDPICTPETAPFLVAEHLHLYYAAAAHKPFDAWLDELPVKRPGLAFLPFRVLGQYRASGVWMFQGSFDAPENSALQKHLQDTAAATERWLGSTSSHAALQATSILFLRSLTAFKNLVGTPLTECHLARRALASLWYTKQDAVLGDEVLGDQECWKHGARDALNQDIMIKVAFGPEAGKLLGFDTARFRCPYIPKSVHLEPELVNAVNIFRDISEAASAVSRRTGRQMRRQIALTAHDYANGLQELLIITGSAAADFDSLPDPAMRLSLANTLADALLGHAWVARDVAKRSHDDTDTGQQTTELKLRDTPPSAADLVFWRDYLRRDAIVIAFSAMSRAMRAAGTFVGSLTLRYRFTGETGDGLWGGNEDWQEIPIGAEALNLCMPRQARRGPVPWPMPHEAHSEKLMEVGQRAAMMWGPRELMRNAFGDTTAYASTHRGVVAVSVDAEIRQEASGWIFRMTVTNPWVSLTQEPKSVYDASDWPNDIRNVLKNVTFKDGPRERGSVAYVYEFEVGNAGT